MMTLPNEMLIMILEKIDNILVLLRLREVNKRFFDAIEFVLVKLNLWKKWCNEDDKKKLWIREIIKLRFPQILENEFESSDSSNWKEIFLSYQKWRNLASYQKPWTIETVLLGNFEPDEIITCMDVWGQDLVIGTNIGKIYFYKINNRVKNKYVVYKEHYIIKIKLWFVGNRTLIAVIFFANHQVSFWDVFNKQKLENIFFNHDSTATACNDHQFYFAINFTVIEYEWKENKFQKGRHIRLEVPDFEGAGVSAIIRAMYADQNKLTIVLQNGRFISTISYIISISELETFPLWANNSFIYPLDSVLLQNVIFYIPINNVVLTIDDSKLYISVKSDGDHEYTSQLYLMDESFRSNIAAVLMYSNILIFGLKSGKIAFYFLENLQSPNLPALSQLTLDTNPIIDFNIVELNDTMYIFATTASKLYMCRASATYITIT